ncbi:glutamate--tRNA ligase [Algimonas ampicilliniresistens]|uniref:Glutamate--tRNA ligase n=1 Tax=Algimonas ampicilliniresistens TaxID=1298735 RepID=A0ABQ5V6Q8_9PROT|nr:glutamate--tRNA ligase [Algimonas ampicilliniresistens]GLQ23236.1 glutamate--tRNA ligase [Algimonas ampicilliniresistens]
MSTSASQTRVRFAPSPTGKLHVGNVRTALMNVLHARSTGGIFILRIDDTDVARGTQENEDAIRDDLTWLGMHWQETFSQSKRFSLYDEAAEKLKEIGLLYPAYDTAEELDRQRKLQGVQGKPPIYDRRALDLTDEQRAAYEAEGRQPHWRFKLSGNPVTWTDLVRGEQTVETSSLSDPVLIRGDGTYLYTLPSVFDDIESGITHVIRGEDHVTNSGAQIEIFRALGGKEPIFAHTPLLVDKDGGKLSKRLDSLSMRQLRDEGYEPMAILSLLAKIGTSDPVEERFTIKQLAEEFSFSKIGRAPARFDDAELRGLNAKILHEMTYDQVKERLDALGVEGGEQFWLSIRDNVEVVDDAAGWNATLYAPMAGIIEADDKAFCDTAAELLGDDTDWSDLIRKLKDNTDRKGKGLFMPLRKALTGRNHGPEMGRILALMGADRARARLRGETA